MKKWYLIIAGIVIIIVACILLLNPGDFLSKKPPNPHKPTTTTSTTLTTTTTIPTTTTSTTIPITTTSTISTTTTIPSTGKVYYVDATNGNDSNSGLSSSSAWKTITKVNNFVFTTGNTVLFKSGETWRGVLKPKGNTNNVVFDSYGTGEKPIISGAIDLSSTSKWTYIGNNVWRSSGLTTEIGQLFFNDDTIVGLYRYETDLGGERPYLPLTTQGDFFYNTTLDYLDLYSTSNPGDYYTNIEASQGMTQTSTWTSQVWNSSYITFKNLNFKYMGGNGFELLGTNSHILFEYCDFYGCGGGKSVNEQRRDGNGIQTWGNNSYITARYCTFDYIMEVACDIQLGSGQKADHFYFYGNTITNVTAAFEVWASMDYTNVTISDIYFFNNTIWNTRNVYYPSYLSRPRSVTISPGPAVVTNGFIINNIFHTSGDYPGANNRGFIYFNGPEYLNGWTVDYNCYYPEHSNAFIIRPTGYSTLSAWQTVSGKDAHSISIDPLFVDIYNRDFNLKANSPCIGKGFYVSGVTNNQPLNIGAY